MGVLSNLQPENVFRFFEEICSIPHGSKDTWHISNYLVNFANERNLKVLQDELGNVIIKKNGTKGYETSPSVIIQGHMDMVCEKDKDIKLDFTKDGLDLMVEGNTIFARGTTLGGDDGIAVAYALAILDSKDIPHPPLEVVITVDEEIGMLGAAFFDASSLSSKRMLNLDSEDEGELLVSCAGGVTSNCEMKFNTQTWKTDDLIKQNGCFYELEVTGVSGGHSGMEIIKQGANAAKVLGRILYACKSEIGDKMCVDTDKVPMYLYFLEGGKKDNAIPREAKAAFVFCANPVEKGKNLNVNNVDYHTAIVEIVDKYNRILKEEYRNTDTDINICLKKHGLGESKNRMQQDTFVTASMEDTGRIISFLHCVPNGVEKRSDTIENMVQTSLNLGIMKMNMDDDTINNKTEHKNKVMFGFSVRSSVESEKKELTSRLKCLIESLGGDYVESGDYPGWEYKEQSPLRDLMVQVFEEQYGKKPQIVSIHAGVECGFFAGKIKELDCVSYGPQMDDIHTSRERLYIDSVKRTWEYTLEILKRLK